MATMAYRSLREFIDLLEERGLLVRVTTPVSTELEMTEIQRRVLAQGGPAILFENAVSSSPPLEGGGWEEGVSSQNTFSPDVGRTPHPTLPLKGGGLYTTKVLVNLFGTVERVALGMGRKPEALREIGETLAFLKQPEPPEGWREAVAMLPIVRQAMAMRPKTVKKAPCQEIVLRGEDIDLDRLPIQTCWPDEPAPLITWPLVVTKGSAKSAESRVRSSEEKGEASRPSEPSATFHVSDRMSGSGDKDIFNLGIYRMQKLNKNQTLMRWLKHRGGAQHHARWGEKNLEPLPCAVVLGADPGTILAAVTPVPDTLSEYQFAGLLRGKPVELVECVTVPLKVPATAEIVLEGHVSLTDYRDEGPYGDHTGYYNSVEPFPVFTISAITMRKDPIYLSTYTGKPPDEPSVLGEALNEVFIPLLQQQFPEIIDFWLPPEGCSYRVAIVSIKKAYAGHGRRIMMAVWSYLRQFIYTKFVIVVDADIDCRDWKEVIWAISTRMDPVRDTMLVEQTPIDYLDFASPVSGLGGKMGLDATNKWEGETDREWGRELHMDDATIFRVSERWTDYGLPPEFNG